MCCVAVSAVGSIVGAAETVTRGAGNDAETVRGPTVGLPRGDDVAKPPPPPPAVGELPLVTEPVLDDVTASPDDVTSSLDEILDSLGAIAVAIWPGVEPVELVSLKKLLEVGSGNVVDVLLARPVVTIWALDVLAPGVFGPRLVLVDEKTTSPLVAEVAPPACVDWAISPG